MGTSGVWWGIPVIPDLERLRQVGCWEFRASLSYMAKLCLKKTNKERESELSGSAGGLISLREQKFKLTKYSNHLRMLTCERKSLVCLGRICDRKKE